MYTILGLAKTNLAVVGLLVNLVREGILGSGGTGAERCVAVLCNFLVGLQLDQHPVNSTHAGTLTSLEAVAPAPWMVSET